MSLRPSRAPWGLALALLAAAPLATADGGVALVEPGIPIVQSPGPDCLQGAEDGRFTVEDHATGRRRVRGRCKDGVPHGTWTLWHATGVKSWVGFMDQGRLSGPFKAWFEDGQKRSLLAFRDGQAHGHALFWWPNGTLRIVGHYEAGLEQGCFRSWHDDGRRAARGAFLDGARVGRWYSWDEHGERTIDEHGGATSKGRCWLPWL